MIRRYAGVARRRVAVLRDRYRGSDLLSVPGLLDADLRAEDLGRDLRQPAEIIPAHPTLAAFRYVFSSENVARYMRNSLAIAIPVTFLRCCLGPAGATR